MEHAFEQPDFADDPQSQTVHVDPDEPTLVRGRIAVVEDGEATRHFLVQALRAQGYAVKGIEDGGSALPLLRLHLPDIVLLDVTLPGRSGFDVCRQIRADPLLRRATVILLTGRAGGADRAEGWHAGADDYLVKPCDFPELLARVDAHMRHREAPQRQWRNPVTRLPAAAALEADLIARLAHGEPFALCFADITYFKSYNNRYGYVAGDGLLVVLADLLREIADEHAGTAGHLGSDDFVIITAPEGCAAVAQALAERFSETAPMLYHGVDRDRGWVPEADHAGATQHMPLVQLALATLVCQPGDLTQAPEGQPPGSVIGPLWERLRAATHPLHTLDQTG